MPQRMSRFALSALGFAALTYNGLALATALYAVLGAPEQLRDSGRIPVEKTFYAPDPVLGWTLQPLIKFTLQDTDRHPLPAPYITTDAHGLRTPLGEKPHQVILLGDSFVQGYYLFDHETISARLHAKSRLGITNAGVGGYSTDQQYLLLLKLLQRLDPNWVVLVFFANDLDPLDKDRAWSLNKPRFAVEGDRLNLDVIHSPAPQTKINRFEPMFGKNEEMFTLADGCCFTDAIDRFFLKVNRTYGHFPHPRSTLGELQAQIAMTKAAPSQYAYQVADSAFYSSPDKFARKWGYFFQIAAQIQRLGGQRDYRTLVFYIPEIAQILRADEDPFAPQRYFMDRCGELRLDCIDPHPTFVRAQQERDLYFMDDGHFSPAGADLAAEIILAHIASAD